MSKKIDFNFLHNFLQFIQAKNKWKISEILDNLDISFKELNPIYREDHEAITDAVGF